MKAIKAIVVGGSKSAWASLYELEIWFDGYDLSKRGKHDYVSYDTLLHLAGGKKGWNFKKVNDFLSTENGLKWLNEILEQRKNDK